MIGAHIPISPYRHRPCSGCVNRVRTFGLAHCLAGKWDDIRDEKPCELHPDPALRPDAAVAR